MTYTSAYQKLTVVLLLVAVLLTVQIECKKVNRDAGHFHRGLLTPCKPGPFALNLDKDDFAKLNQGKPVMKQEEEEGGESGTAVCVQDVDAPKNAVWSQILNLPAYVGKVSKVVECENYEMKSEITDDEKKQMRIKTRMKVKVVPGYSYEYYCNHIYSPDADSMTWTLDYDKLSDFDDVAGHWHLEPIPEKPGATRVFYTCNIKLRGSVPGIVKDLLVKKALKDATAWVKKESEANKAGISLPDDLQVQPAF